MKSSNINLTTVRTSVSRLAVNKDDRKPLSSIYLLIPGFIFLLSFVVNSLPGALLYFYLIGIIFCLPSVAFSETKNKWIGILLSVIFVILSFSETERTLDYQRRQYQHFKEIIEKRDQMNELKGSFKNLPASDLADG